MKFLVRRDTNEYRGWCLSGNFRKKPEGMVTHIYEWKHFDSKQFGECCGSNISLPGEFLSCAAGVNICFTKYKISLPVDTELYSYHRIYGEGEWINIMLYHGEEILKPIFGKDVGLEYGNVYSLHSRDLIGDNDCWPDGVYLMILTREQPGDRFLTYAKEKGLVLEWESPTFANHNYSDDCDRLTMYVLRKGERK